MTRPRPRIARTAPTWLVLAVSLAAAASAQQFQLQPGMIPGAARWTEGVECADVDHDGDLDLFFADGEGFSSAGLKRQNVLLINHFVPSGTLSFSDESGARLGTHLSNAKGVITGDVNGDGWVDALFLNAFDTDTPLLYINRGAANPGVFTMESAARGLTTPLASGGGQFGDLDDDGDLDLILNDAYLGSGSRKPRLYFNDGAGFFTQTPAAIAAAAAKSAQMDTQLVDLDGDWDLDFVGFCRAANGGTNHYLMLNDGAGTFSNAPVSIPSNSASTYEGEVGDLDGDDDIDMFLVSSSGFAEGVIRNELVPSGALSLTAQPALLDGNDDNEIVLFDYDVDGDYDAIVGSLSNSRETFWTNNGSGSFTNAGASIITSVSDPTLDATVADLDNDGRYDLVTAQGESNAAQWANKVYRNTGPFDTRRPIVTAIDSPLIAPPTGPVKVHARIRDQVLDDGVNYVRGAGYYTILSSIPAPQGIGIGPGGLSQPNVPLALAQSALWANNLATPQTIQLSAAPYDYVVAQLAPGQSVEHRLVRPGVYGYTVSPAGYVGTLTVSGVPSNAQATYSGGQCYRFLMSDTLAGAGVWLFYELEFTDWAGNRAVTTTAEVHLLDCTPSVYCSAKLNSLGCLPAISSTGSPSTAATSGFVIRATNLINQSNGLLFYGFNGQIAAPFQGGTMCVAPPRWRTAISNSGGSAGGSDCSGELSIDFNSYMSGGTAPVAFGFGQSIDGQYWSRDPADPFTTNTTNAIHFAVCQ